jgi:hypothetical protein
MNAIRKIEAKVEIYCGQSIDKAIKECKDLLQDYHEESIITFDFNGIDIEVKKTMNTKDIIDRYHKGLRIS